MEYVNRKELKKAMIELDYSVDSLSKELNISRQALYNYLNSKRQFNENLISKLFSLFGASIFFDYQCKQIAYKYRKEKK